MTLDEVVWSGLPVICSPFGALPERVEAWRVGYVFDNSLDGIREVLARIVGEWALHLEKFSRTHDAPIISVNDEVLEYVPMYERSLGSRKVDSEGLVRFLQPDLCTEYRSVKEMLRRGKINAVRRIKFMLSESESLSG